MQNLEIGSRLFNHGDMANFSGWLTITKRIEDSHTLNYQVVDELGDTQLIPVYVIQDVYRGNGSTRIVTESAYQAFIQMQF